MPNNKNISTLINHIHKEPFFSGPKNNVVLFKGDCLNILSKIPDSSIDLIFADPPYFLSNGGITCHAGKMVSVNKGKWDESKGIEDNHEFNKAWLSQCQRVLTDEGTIWVSGTAHVIHSIGYAMQQLGYKLLNDIVWFKVNPPPNLCCRYFTHSTETIIWAAKNKKSKHVFNYNDMKAVRGKQMKNIWQDLIDEFTVNFKSNFPWSITPPKNNEKIHGKHPTQKPLKLLERIILASSKPEDIVLDPFCGSGTTGVAALKENRRFIGVELEKEYLVKAKKRIEDQLKTK